jgi:hypothetical protein
MPFVKLDNRLLDSSLWPDRVAREVFITALLMCEPFELPEDVPQLAAKNLAPTGWTVPAGDYGLVRAAGVGIIRRAMVDLEEGLMALERLGAPEAESRNPDHDGRRLVRIGSIADIGGGFLVLNYQKYRDFDYTTAERSKRYREKKKRDKDRMVKKVFAEFSRQNRESFEPASRSRCVTRDVTVRHAGVTEEEVEVEAYGSGELQNSSPDSGIGLRPPRSQSSS